MTHENLWAAAWQASGPHPRAAFMPKFAQDVFLAAGQRTPFGRGGGALSHYDPISLSVPLVQAMAQQVAPQKPDLFLWGTVTPDLEWSNIAREIWLDAGLDPTVPSFSTVLACSTSMAGVFTAAGMLRAEVDVIMVGGVEVMSRQTPRLTPEATAWFQAILTADPVSMSDGRRLTPKDFLVPSKGWVNRITGRSMGDHMEETAKQWGITREAQDAWALQSHQRAVSAWEKGFFKDLVIPLPELERDANVRVDTSLEKLASLAPVFDKTSGQGTLTAGNSSPITDGAAGIWVVSSSGRKRLPEDVPAVKLVDYELAAVDFTADGLLMAPPVAIARLLDRHGLVFSDISLWEIHEAFAGQVRANVAALESPDWITERTKITRDFGPFPWERVNPNGGSLALGHPFGATGTRILSQAVKELAAMPKGSKALVSICADGGQGTVALLENI